MKIKNKKALSAALAATLTSGVLSTAAHATANVDELYTEAYNATMKALAEKTQDSINVAREAISKLPKELDWAIGEFSKQVDTVQHPILVNIVDAINNAQKTEKQADINTARKAIPSNLLEVWKNSYSTAVDEVQQKLMSKTVEAIEAAKKSQKEEDIKAAQALIDDIKTVENNEGVKTWIGQIDKEFQEAIALTVKEIKVTGKKTIEVNFNNEVDASTVSTKSFRVYDSKNEEDKLFISSVKVAEDKKSVTVTTFEGFDSSKEYSIVTSGVANKDGKVMEAHEGSFKYENAEVASIEFVNTTVKNGSKVEVLVKDTLGRDITNNVNIEYEISNKEIVDEVNGALTAKKNGNAIVVAKVVEDGVELAKTSETIIRVKDGVATSFQGFTVADTTTQKYSDLKDSEKVDYVFEGSSNNTLKVFYKDQYGNEKVAAAASTDTVVGFDKIVSLTPEVIVVDKAGAITPISKGVGYVKVEIDGIVKTIAIEVKADGVASKVALDKTSVVVGKDKQVENNIKVQLFDQYGKDIALNKADFKVTVKNEKGNFVEDTDTTKLEVSDTGEIVITGKDRKVGTKTYQVEYAKGDIKLNQQFTIVTKEAGDVEKYEVTVNASDLDLNDKNPDTKHTANIEVFELDSNGTRINNITDKATVLVTDSKNDSVTLTDSKNIKVAELKKEGTYKVEVKVDTLTVKTFTLTVKNTAETATAVVFNSYTAEVAEGATAQEILFGADGVAAIKDQYGKDMDFSATPDKLVVTTVKANEVVKDGKVSSYDLVVRSIKVVDKELITKPVIVKVAVK